jgi:hypothetical protein
MAALTANTTLGSVVQWNNPEGIIIDYPVKAASVIYKGGFVGAAASGLFGIALTAGVNFIGVALEKVTGGTNDGDKTVKTLCGAVWQWTVTATLTIANIGDVLFAIDDNPLAMTLTDTSNSSIGRIINVPLTAGSFPANTVIVKTKFPGEPMGFSNAATILWAADPK